MAQVGLWTDAGALLAQATIPSGTVTPIDSGFRYVSLLAPILLSPGQSYVVAGRAGSTDQTVFMQHNAVFASQITYGVDRFGPNGSFTFPSFAGSATSNSVGDFGGSFRFSPVPEPSSVSLLVAGVVMVAFVRFRQCRLTRLSDNSFLRSALVCQLRGGGK